MCDVEAALIRALIIQLSFLVKDWDDYQKFVRLACKL